MSRTTTARQGPLPAALLTAAGLLVVVAFVSLVIGTRVMGFGEVIDGLRGTDPIASPIIWELRLPRTELGLLVGAALGAAGVIAQSVTRNPLADPGLLGISSGAAVAIVVGSAFFGVVGGTGQMALAVVGAAVATVAVFAFAQRAPEGLTPVSMTLAGMALTAFLGGIISGVTLLSSDSMDQYRFWIVGALNIPEPAMLASGAALIALGGALAAIISGSLNAMALGDDTASALGVRVQRTRLLAGLAVVLLSGAAVSLSGPITFIGLIIPHAARMLVGNDVRRALAMAAVLGPLLLVTADVIGRVVVRPGELQVGVVTAVIGTPVFIWLTRRTRTGARSGS